MTRPALEIILLLIVMLFVMRVFRVAVMLGRRILMNFRERPENIQPQC